MIEMDDDVITRERVGSNLLEATVVSRRSAIWRRTS
jgi:hypothetical protein